MCITYTYLYVNLPAYYDYCSSVNPSTKQNSMITIKEKGNMHYFECICNMRTQRHNTIEQIHRTNIFTNLYKLIINITFKELNLNVDQ